MTELKSYFIEKNISEKEFAKTANIKIKKLKKVLNNQAFFSEKEMKKVSSLLGVSPTELYNGVTRRIGELPDVAENNNLNHFRYFIKRRMKNARLLLNFLSFVDGLFFVGIFVIYVMLMFAGISGLPTILRSIDVLLLCFVVPVCGMLCLTDIAREKVFGKKVTPNSNINVETVGTSLLVIVFAISSFVNDFIPVVSLALAIIGAVAFSAISIIAPFKKKPFYNRFIQFVVYMLPTLLLIISESFAYKYVVSITPAEEGAEGEALAFAADMFGTIFCLLIFIVFIFSLVRYYDIFIKGAGKLFSPCKKTTSITKSMLVMIIISYIVIGCLTVLSVWVSQGLYLKYVYTNMFEGKEDTINWTSEFITDYETDFKKGEYDVVKFEGMKIKIPKEYKLDEESEYTTVYKNGEEHVLMLEKPFNEQSLDFDLFDEDFGDGKFTQKQIEEMKEAFIESFGFYPTNFFEWQKLNGTVTLDDIDIFNPRKTVMLSTVFIMKATTTVPNSQYYLYENGDLCANIIIHTIENEEKGDREMVSVSFGSTDLEYGITIVHPAKDSNAALDVVTKILNSIEMK